MDDELRTQVDAVAGTMELASAELIASRALLRRRDYKFLASDTVVPDLLAGLAETHAVMRVQDCSVASYDTVYFDTPDRRCFHDHRRGRRRRVKLRVRSYLERSLTMLEVKQRRGPSMTHKARLQVEDLEDLDWDFAHEHAGDGPWQPVLHNRFRRVSLVGLEAEERVTIDFDIQVGAEHPRLSFGPVSVIEVKTLSRRRDSPALVWLRNAGLRTSRFSKYCVGSMALDPSLRGGTVTEMVRALERLAS